MPAKKVVSTPLNALSCNNLADKHTSSYVPPLLSLYFSQAQPLLAPQECNGSRGFEASIYVVMAEMHLPFALLK